MFRDIILLFFFSFILAGCRSGGYPKERFIIAPDFLSLFNSIRINSNLSFTTLDFRTKKFVITGVDSTIRNCKGGIMSQRPYKSLKLYLKEIGNDTLKLQRSNEIFLGKDPATLTNGITIQFNNFYFGDTTLPKIIHDTLRIINKKYSGYYIFNTMLEPRQLDDIVQLYFSPTKGIIGFVTLSGEVWGII